MGYPEDDYEHRARRNALDALDANKPLAAAIKEHDDVHAKADKMKADADAKLDLARGSVASTTAGEDPEVTTARNAVAETQAKIDAADQKDKAAAQEAHDKAVADLQALRDRKAAEAPKPAYADTRTAAQKAAGVPVPGFDNRTAAERAARTDGRKLADGTVVYPGEAGYTSAK
jgi:hypothetical protein